MQINTTSKEKPLLEHSLESDSLEIQADRLVLLQGEELRLEACVFTNPSLEHGVRWMLEQGTASLSHQYGRTTMLRTNHRSETLVVVAWTADRRLSQRLEIKVRPPNFQALSCGYTHSLALSTDEQVLTWGDNRHLVPTPIGLNDIQAVAAGGQHSLVLTKAQTVLSWGDNSLNQLGRLWQDPDLALAVTGLTDVLEIHAGAVHSLACHTNGLVSAWGSNLFGQLGHVPLSAQIGYSRVSQLDRVYAIKAGFGHSLALTEDGQVFAWGDNGYGQLGIGTTIDSFVPHKIILPIKVAAIEAGMYHSVALTKDGQVLTWGRGFRGAIGKHLLSDSHNSLPTVIPELDSMALIAAGHGFTVACSGQGEVFIWNQHRVWNSKFLTYGQKPSRIIGLEEIVAIQAGSAHVLALRADGTLFAWGNNAYGQLGISQVPWLDSPCPVVLPKGVRLKMPM
jgi:alpha-tubulin suppressor-like RCC1 family protein